MKAQYENIIVQLDMTIDDDGVVDTTSNKYRGQLYQKQTFDVLIYDETLEDGGTIRNLVTIHPQKVTIKRSGSINMSQQFLENRKTDSVYRHPYGNMLMETTTTSISYDPMNHSNQGKLTISYTVKLNGTNERKHQLMISYLKEDV